jgi:hypothetical protein
MAIQDGPRLGVLRPQINPVIGEHSHRVGYRLNNTRPDGSTCGGQLSTAAVQPSLHRTHGLAGTYDAPILWIHARRLTMAVLDEAGAKKSLATSRPARAS